jgi:hypothetical protein
VKFGTYVSTPAAGSGDAADAEAAVSASAAAAAPRTAIVRNGPIMSAPSLDLR